MHDIRLRHFLQLFLLEQYGAGYQKINRPRSGRLGRGNAGDLEWNVVAARNPGLYRQAQTFLGR